MKSSIAVGRVRLRVSTEPECPAAFYTGKPESDGCVTEARDRRVGRILISDRGTFGVCHNSGLPAQPLACKLLIIKTRRDVRVVEGARLESVCRGNSTVGSNPTLSANLR